MKRRTGLCLTGALASILVATVALAVVPQTINYQGYLADASGTPVNGTMNMIFSLYTSPAGTTSPLWTETHQNVQVSQGRYSVVLGNGSPTAVPLDLPFDKPYYLGVTVGFDSEMTPRLPLTSMGYAMRAAVADSIASSGSVTITGGANGNIVIVPGGSGTVDVSNTRITNVANPAASTDVATKQYVDSQTMSSCPSGQTIVSTGSGQGSCKTICSGVMADCDGNPANGCEANLLIDWSNCASCGHACSTGNVCAGGVCVQACPTHLAACGVGPATTCVDLKNDTANCGACGFACAIGQGCYVGNCACTLTAEVVCGGRCADTRTDRLNCGACGRVCPNGTACWAGSCATGLACTGAVGLPGVPMVQALSEPLRDSGGYPYYISSMAAGDVNGDGKPDFVAVNNYIVGQNYYGRIMVIKNKGNGLFDPPVSQDTQDLFYGNMQLVDVNSDNKPDIVEISYRKLSVLLNSGNGTFVPSNSYDLGSDSGFFTMGDVNGDGKPDVAVIDAPIDYNSGTYGTGTVAVRINNGDGTFGSPAIYITGKRPLHAAIGDINNDGLGDMAVTNGDDQNVIVFINNGNGTFGNAYVTVNTSSYPYSARIADLNGDGKADLIVAIEGGLEVFMNQGNGAFGPGRNYLSGTSLDESIMVADVNLDGSPDIAIMANGSLAILANNGQGLFAPPAFFPPGYDMRYVLAGDFNGDGLIDFAGLSFHQSKIAILLNAGRSGPVTSDSLLAARSFPAGGVVGGSVIADFNADGKPDFAVTNGGQDKTVSILLNDGMGQFTSRLTSGVGGSPGAIAAGDLNGDSIPDVAVSFWTEKNVGLLLSRGDGTFATPVTYIPQDGNPSGIAIGDVNNDGKQDLFVATTANLGGGQYKHDLKVFLNTGNATFGTPATYTIPSLYDNTLTIGDLNRDGWTDVVAADRAANRIYVLLNRGDGTFTTPITYTIYAGGYPYVLSAAIGDINGDGWPEIAVASFDSNLPDTEPGTVTVLLNAGNGTFTTGQNYGVCYSPWGGLAIADLDGDSKSDIAVACSYGEVGVLRNTGNGTMSLFSSYPDVNSHFASSISIIDMNGDGKKDLAFAGYGTVDVLLNKGCMP